MQTGLHQLASVDNRLVVLVDGNFQHCHQKAAGRNQVPLVTPQIFVNPANLDTLKEHIRQQELVRKISKKIAVQTHIKQETTHIMKQPGKAVTTLA
ncbi:hypothetical protein PCASD_19036 [Puccinia coronata f. sp. avenae]|uniref:Uncharacterized protein n=1 Tax=Puccinia coronata f. sp. avenae TaxID=200324 RepID=A0A2N5TWN6_9BASI|nr:hypothetical protein PCASD_19036 [Puccinia coronata f. sp. avenae]